MNVFQMIAVYFSYSFVRYAFIAGVLTALCASVLGVTLVLKRYSFIGDGLSHVAFGAMAIAAVLSVTNEMIIVMPLTVLCAVLLLAGGSHAKIKGDAEASPFCPLPVFPSCSLYTPPIFAVKDSFGAYFMHQKCRRYSMPATL